MERREKRGRERRREIAFILSLCPFLLFIIWALWGWEEVKTASGSSPLNFVSYLKLYTCFSVSTFATSHCCPQGTHFEVCVCVCVLACDCDLNNPDIFVFVFACVVLCLLLYIYVQVVSDLLAEASNSGSVISVCETIDVYMCVSALQECVLGASLPFEAADRKHLSKQDRELLLQSIRWHLNTLQTLEYHCKCDLGC